MSEILRFVCDHCGKQLSAKPQHAGRSTRCPGCQKPVTVPLPVPVPSHSEELDDNDIFRLLGGSTSSQEADAGTETETSNVTEPVQTDATSATSNEMQTEKSLAITGRFQRLAQLPRVIVVAGGLVLVALVGLVGWSLTKSARTTPVAVDKQDDDLEAVDQRAAPVAVDKQNHNPPAAVVEKPRAESIDLLKGDIDETSIAYFKQQFPESVNVDGTVKFCSSVDTQGPRASRMLQGAQEDNANPNYSFEFKAKATKEALAAAASFKQLLESDTFLLREGYKFSACRLVVTRRRFQASKDAFNRANTRAEMQANTEAMKTAEARVKVFEGTHNVLGNRMTQENLDTTAIRRTAGLD